MIVRDTLVFRTLLAIARQRDDYDEPRSHALLELLATADAVRADLRYRLHAITLSESQFATLVVLRALDPEAVLPTTLAHHVGASRATMTAVLDHLLARLLIVRARSHEDRRNYLITLTDAGRALADDAERVLLRGCAELSRALEGPAPRALLALCADLVPPARPVPAPDAAV
ncbi:MAG: MarR family transcriptional regulator [Opitutaceae bacterium]